MTFWRYLRWGRPQQVSGAMPIGLHPTFYLNIHLYGCLIRNLTGRSRPDLPKSERLFFAFLDGNRTGRNPPKFALHPCRRKI